MSPELIDALLRALPQVIAIAGTLAGTAIGTYCHHRFGRAARVEQYRWRPFEHDKAAARELMAAIDRHQSAVQAAMSRTQAITQGSSPDTAAVDEYVKQQPLLLMEAQCLGAVEFPELVPVMERMQDSFRAVNPHCQRAVAATPLSRDDSRVISEAIIDCLRVVADASEELYRSVAERYRERHLLLAQALK